MPLVTSACFNGLSPDEQDAQLYEALGGDPACWYGLSREERRAALYVAAGGSETCFVGRSREEQEKLLYEAFYANASDTSDLVEPGCFNGLSPDLRDYNIWLSASRN